MRLTTWPTVAMPAGAGSVDSNTLMRECRKDKESGSCLGYVLAVSNLLAAFRHLDASDLHKVSTTYGVAIILVCAPEATAGQMAAIVYRYLDAHPEQWHLDGNILVVRALGRAWSCLERTMTKTVEGQSPLRLENGAR